MFPVRISAVAVVAVAVAVAAAVVVVIVASGYYCWPLTVAIDMTFEVTMV